MPETHLAGIVIPMYDTKVLDLGGSLVAPDAIAVEFLKSFERLIGEYLAKDSSRRLIMVIGGGSPARKYQDAYRKISDSPENDEADWIGIAATRLNARLIKAVFEEFCTDEVVTDPTNVGAFTGRVLVASGWKPGFSTDYDAVLLAEKFDARVLINLTNIAKVYTADPKIDKSARLSKILSITIQKYFFLGMASGGLYIQCAEKSASLTGLSR